MKIQLEKSAKIEKQTTIDAWVKSYSGELFVWASYKVHNKEVAEDLVQDTFLAAFRAFHTFQHKSHPKTWLFSILKNKIVDYYRENARNGINISLGDVLPNQEIFDKSENWKLPTDYDHWEEEQHLLDNQEFLKVMQQCMTDLPPQWEAMVKLKYFEGKNAKDICQEYDISPSNYWQILHRAKVLLKKCIETLWS